MSSRVANYFFFSLSLYVYLILFLFIFKLINKGPVVTLVYFFPVRCSVMQLFLFIVLFVVRKLVWQVCSNKLLFCSCVVLFLFYCVSVREAVTRTSWLVSWRTAGDVCDAKDKGLIMQLPRKTFYLPFKVEVTKKRMLKTYK